MRFNSMKTRLLALEQKSGTRNFVLCFAGSTRSVHVRDPLGVLLDAFRRESARCESEPQPVSTNDELLDLMGSADGLVGEPDPLVILLQEILKGNEVQ
jgi:hypothetical protein